MLTVKELADHLMADAVAKGLDPATTPVTIHRYNGDGTGSHAKPVTNGRVWNRSGARIYALRAEIDPPYTTEPSGFLVAEVE